MNITHRTSPRLAIATAALLLLAGCASSDAPVDTGTDGGSVTEPGKADNSGQPDTSKLPKSKTGGYTHGMPMTDFNFESSVRIPEGQAVRVTLPEEVLGYKGLGDVVLVEEFVITPVAFDTLEVLCGVAMDVKYTNPDVYETHYADGDPSESEALPELNIDPIWSAAIKAAGLPIGYAGHNPQFGLPNLDDPNIEKGTYISKDRSQALMVNECTDMPVPGDDGDYVLPLAFVHFVDYDTRGYANSIDAHVGVTSVGEMGVSPRVTTEKGETRIGDLFFEQSTQKWRKQ